MSSRRETEIDALTSMTARNDEIAGNPHRPKGFGPNGTVCVVAPSRNERALPRAARLAFDPVALRTLLSIPLLQATNRSGREVSVWNGMIWNE